MSAFTFRAFRSGAAILAIWCAVCVQSRAEEKNTPALAAAMKDARATLEQGLGTAGQTGRPISAKFEVEDGKLQLSIYVDASDGFKEVLIDPQSGASASAEKITDADDLKDANEQSAAMARQRQLCQRLSSMRLPRIAVLGSSVPILDSKMGRRSRPSPCCAAITSARSAKSWIDHRIRADWRTIQSPGCEAEGYDAKWTRSQTHAFSRACPRRGR